MMGRWVVERRDGSDGSTTDVGGIRAWQEIHNRTRGSEKSEGIRKGSDLNRWELSTRSEMVGTKRKEAGVSDLRGKSI